MSRPTIPILAVIGGKASGKTTAMEIIVRALSSRDLLVMTVKHVSEKGFTLDREGTDTWRHWKAGARIVSTVSDCERAVLFKDEDRINLDEYDSWAGRVDVIVFEGFSSLLLKEENVAKVVCLREQSEGDSYLADIRGEVVALCSFNVMGDGVLKLGVDDEVLGERAIQFFLNFERSRRF
jgi:molybdopterin-guanine dinucleotide biosynthesis protein B